GIDRTAVMADKLEQALVRLEEVARHMGMTAMYGNLLTAAAHASPFLEVCGDVIVGWMLLWRARIASQALSNGGKEKDSAFYEGQIKGAEFFTEVMLPVAMGRMEAILSGSSAAIDIPEDSFGGK
ncbi:MAG: acyl-CoA dehydrogenase C-terminal domain-containing protein, partial [Thermoanaerobaculia bacterium]